MLQPMGLQRAGYDLVTEQQKVLLGQSKHGSESESSFFSARKLQGSLLLT